MGHPRPLFISFRLFKHTLQLQQINVKKFPSSIQCQDSNSQHESPPITTRPGLLPKENILDQKVK